MGPAIATIVVAIGILGLFVLDRDHNTRTSGALWIPVAWLSISASRMVSQWLGAPLFESSDQLLEGNTLDALIFAGLLACGLIVLLSRSQVTVRSLRENAPLILFLLYCLISVLWSDYPFVAFKRWTKAVGDLTMVLVVLTDSNPSAALKRLLSRVGFVMIPLSILFIRYFPTLGRAYSSWTGEAYNIGVATGKNSLGYVCLIFGLGSLWCFLDAYRGHKSPLRNRVLLAHGALLALALWLFSMANSATSFACFLIGGTLILVTKLPSFAGSPVRVHLLVGLLVFVAVYALILDPGAGLVQTMGRDPTLTGRTELWGQALRIPMNREFGAGYESFWLGNRLEQMWQINWEHPNQAHNGYLEVYLDLGWVGLALIGLVMVWGYRSVVRTLLSDRDVGEVKLAFFVVAVVYNLTEHGFRELHPVWLAFLLAVTVVPEASATEEADGVEMNPDALCIDQLAANANAFEEIT